MNKSAEYLLIIYLPYYKYFRDNDIVQPTKKLVELQDKEPVG